MKRTLMTFAAIYAMVIGATSCGPSSNGSPAVAPGQYIQIERLARPAIKEAFQMFANHDSTNRTAPWAQPYASQSLYAEIGSFTTNVAGRPTIAPVLQKLLIPDEMQADLSQTGGGSYLGTETGGATSATKSKFGGRTLLDDVIDIDLGAVFGPTLTDAPGGLGLVKDDGKEIPCLTTDNVPSQAAKDNITPAVFPYVGAPH